MTHLDLVIEAARKGMAESGFQMDASLENLLRIVYLAGYGQATKEHTDKSDSSDQK